MILTTLRFRALLLAASAFMLSPLSADEIGDHPNGGKTYQIPAVYISAENRLLVRQMHTKNNRRPKMYIPPAPMRE